jgi:hypothetical protein
MTDPTHITVCDGKYTLILDPSNLRALRYGEAWRDLTGDGFVMALGQEIVELREKLFGLQWVVDLYDGNPTGQDIANELADYAMILGNVGKVYCHATGGMISKANTLANEVISAIDDHVTSLVNDEISYMKEDSE